MLYSEMHFYSEQPQPPATSHKHTPVNNPAPFRTQSGIKLVTFKRRDNVYLTLESALTALDNPSIHTTAIKCEEHKEHRLYRIDIAKTQKNMLLKKSLLDPLLAELNSKGGCTCFVVFKGSDSKKYGKQKSSRNKSKCFCPDQDIISRLQAPALPANHIRPNLNYTDLIHEPFFSIDSLGVRLDGKPVYGDIDDVFHVERLSSGYRVKVGFADITGISRLCFEDNLLKNAMRFGYSLYSGNKVHSMLGQESEASCSLLEQHERMAWIIDFRITVSNKLSAEPDSKARCEIDRSSLTIYRARIKNQMQMDYNTEVQDVYNPELAEGLKNVRNAAKLLEESNPLLASQMFKLKDETTNYKAVAQLMIHSRNLLGEYFMLNGYPAIYRIQYLSTSRKDLEKVKRVLRGFHCEVQDSQLTDPIKLSSLLIRLLTSSKPKDVQAGINISDYLLGKACYSCDPVSHEIIGYEPYSELKGLRKLSGFINQHVLDAINSGSDPQSLAPIIKNLCNIANTRRYQIREAEANWYRLCRITARAMNRQHRKIARKKFKH